MARRPAAELKLTEATRAEQRDAPETRLAPPFRRSRRAPMGRSPRFSRPLSPFSRRPASRPQTPTGGR